MARARNIKPGLYKNEELAECSVWARYIFPGLWMLADREGRLEDRPKRIKGELLPFDDQSVEPLLKELATKGFIFRYNAEDVKYIQISKFKEHQSPHYSEKQSVIKPPTFSESPPPISPPNSEKEKPIKEGSQPPDSLIHRFSDSPNPEKTTQVESPTRQEPTLPGTMAGAMATELIRKGVQVTSQNPLLQAWVNDNITIPHLIECVGLARHYIPEPDPIAAKYLDSIVRKPRKPAQPTWWTTEQGIIAKGQELGISARPGESMDQFKDRIREKSKERQVA